MNMSYGERELWGPWTTSDKETQDWGRAKMESVAEM